MMASAMAGLGGLPLAGSTLSPSELLPEPSLAQIPKSDPACLVNWTRPAPKIIFVSQSAISTRFVSEDAGVDDWSVDFCRIVGWAKSE